MRNVLLALLAGLLLGGVGVWSISVGRAPHPGENAHEPVTAGSGDGSRAEAWVHLDDEARKLAGVEVAPVEALELPVEREVYGRILDPTPLASLAFELEAAGTAEAVARRELERVRLLFRSEENASARELEAAEVATARARLALDTARAQLATSWGAQLAGRDDLPALVRRLVEGRGAVVRVDVPPGAPAPEDPQTTRLVAFEAEAPLASSFLGSAPQTDPLLQGQGLLFLVERDPPAPGTAVAAWLRAPGPAVSGVDVPRAALLRHAGAVFVYVEREPGSFERRALALVRPSDAGWLATGPLAAGDRLVVAGAPILLSSELQPQLEQD